MTRSFTVCLLALILGPGSQTHAQRHFGTIERGDSGGPLSIEQAAFDVTFYDLALSILPETKSIVGTLKADVELLDSLDVLVLDLDSVFVIDDILVTDHWAGSSILADFRHENGRLRIDLGGVRPSGTRLTAAILYGGRPRVAPRPPWIGGFTWSETASGEPWIGVSCQMDGADIWWPVKDHPSDKPDSVALHFTVDTALVAAANGRLESVENNGDGTHTWHWFVSTPISNYTVSVNVAPYEEISGVYESVTGDSVPYSFWVLPQRLEDGRRQYEQFKKELRFLEETLGPYPFRADKYGVAHTPYLGMEHQTIIAYGSTFETNRFGFDWLHFHELAHEWWANLVTAADWKDFWIHEGFATYMEALAAEAFRGPSGYRQYMARLRLRIRNRRPVAPAEVRSAGQMYFTAGGTVSDSDMYFKGAWILHTLRYLIGDEMMRRALRRMAYPTKELESVTDGSQVRFVDTSEFIMLVESLTGRDLDWFFDLYLRQPGLPELVVVREAETLSISWRTPDDLPFPMPVEVSVGGNVRRVDVPDGGTSVTIPENVGVTIDPHGWILRAR